MSNRSRVSSVAVAVAMATPLTTLAAHIVKASTSSDIGWD
jgi:hypothetical protein